VESKRHYAACLTNIVNFLVALKYMKLIFRALFLWAFTYGDTGKENFSQPFSTSLLNWLL
jgi:hypothetical protein